MRSAEGKAALSFSLLAALIIGFIMLNTSGVITLASLRAQLAEEEIAMVALSEEEAEENHFLRIDGDDIEADLITIENDYLNNTLIIEVEGEDADYFTNHPLAGNSDHIYGMWCGETDKGFEFDIELDSLYEFCLTSGEGCYYVDFAEAHDVYDKVVVIDPGHGGESSPGTVRQGILESDITLDIGLLVFEMLSEQEDLGVYITRVDDVDTSLDDRVYLANTFDADAFVSIHCNSTTSGEMDGIGGTEVLYNTTDASGKSQKLAELLAETVSYAFDTTNRGIVSGDEIRIIRTSEAPVALVEVGFMSNWVELNKLTDEDYQRCAAEGICDGILEFLEE